MPITKNQSTKKVKLNLKGLSEEGKVEAKLAAGEIIVDAINSHLNRSQSPVKGGKFKRTKADGSTSILFDNGDLRSHITFEESATGIVVGIFEDAPDVERKKSFNHNTGDTLPKRKFIPSPNQKFNDSIMRKVDSEIDEIRREESTDRALSLRDEGTGEFSFGEISPSISTILDEDFLDRLILGVINGN